MKNENKIMKIKRENIGGIQEYHITINNFYFVIRQSPEDKSEYNIYRTDAEFDTYLDEIPYGYIDTVYSYKQAKEFLNH